jgi:hypothetical protein
MVARLFSAAACVAALLHGGNCDDIMRGRPSSWWLPAAAQPAEESGSSDRLEAPQSAKKSNATIFRWAHFPSYDTIRFVVFGAPAAASHWKITVDYFDGAAVVLMIAQLQGALPVPASGHTWAIPPLVAGSYTVTMELVASKAGADCARAVVRCHMPIFR